MTNPQIEISTDRSRLDLQVIFRYLSEESYWAKGRKYDVFARSLENSLCFGAYREGELVGFGRVVTDYAVFAWLMDVFVLEGYQGNGIGKKLMQAIMSHPELQTVGRWGLVTRDAHQLYRQFGFEPLSDPGKMMEIKTVTI
jgi:GNAT superfamily N-acetyltransferase